MTNMPRLITRPIFVILALAFILRVWGIHYALPQFFVNDERALVYGALKMIELKTVLPVLHQDEFRVLNYSPLPSYFYLLTLTPVIGAGYLFSPSESVTEYKNQLAVDSGFIFFAARLLMALIGVLNIYVIYILSKRLFESEGAGIFAALFLSTSFFHVQLSHVARQWMPATFLIYSAWLAALGIIRHPSPKKYILAGLFAGMGVGTNSASAVAMIPPVLAHFLKEGGESFRKRIFRKELGYLLFAFLLIAGILIAVHPYGLTQGETQSGEAGGFLVSKLERFKGVTVAGWLEFLWFYAKLLFRYETALLLAALLGGLFSLKKQRAWLLIVVSFIVIYLTLLYIFFNKIPRGMTFILPALAILAGYAADELWKNVTQRFSQRRPLFLFSSLTFAVLLFGWSLAIVFRYDHLLSQKDTRILAKEWIETTIPAGTKILGYLPNLRLTNTKEGIRNLEAIDAGALRISDRSLMAWPDERYPRSAYSLLNLHFVSNDHPLRLIRDKESFRAMGYRYFVVEYEYENQIDLDSQSRELIKKATLLKRFDQFGDIPQERAIDIRGEVDMVPPGHMFSIERFGPTVVIYEL